MNNLPTGNPPPAAWVRWQAGDVVDCSVVAITLVILAAVLGSSFDPSYEETAQRYAPAAFAAVVLAAMAAVFFVPTFTGTKQLARRLFLIISGTALVTATLGASAQITQSMCPKLPDPTVAPLPRLFFLISVIAGMLWSAHALVEPVKRSVRRRWWNMGASDNAAPPDWKGILDMLCNDTSEPMRLEAGETYPDGRGEIRVEASIGTASALIFIMSLGVLFGIALDYILYPRVPDIFVMNDGVERLANLSGNLTAFLALVAAAISIVFTYQQLRAKVRADSRQAWVTKVRELIADVLENIHDVSQYGRESSHFSRLNGSRTLLELHLNPAEADHRLLMLLIRASAFSATVLDNDRETAQQLAAAMEPWIVERQGRINGENCRVLTGILSAYLAPQPSATNKRRVLPRKDRDRTVSFMFKLSHAILKREWERVRYTR